MSPTRIVVLSLVALLALGVAACTPQGPDVTEDEQDTADQRPEQPSEDSEEGETGEGGGGETFTFVAVDIDWQDAPSELPAGEVALELDNQGNIFHDLTVEELGDEIVAEAEGGETDTGSVELEAGEYTFYCSVPGHRESGMETTVTVS